MNFKTEFLTNISRLIKESERKLQSMQKSSKKQVGSRSVKPMGHTTDNSFRERSLFDLLITPSGYKEITEWLQRKSSSVEMPNESCTRHDKDNELNEYDEFRVHYLFKEILNEVYENQIQDIFDLFETKNNSKITNTEIYLIITFMTAMDSVQTLEFLYLFGDKVFQALSMGQSRMGCSRMKSFGKLIGITERKLLAIMKDLNLNEDHEVSFEEFELFYFTIFDELESNLGKTGLATPSSRKESKIRSCRNGCAIF